MLAASSTTTDLVALLPIAAFWAGANTVLSAAKMINQMRDTVVLGKVNGLELSDEHANIMILDYKLVSVGTIIATWAFSAMFFVAGWFSGTNFILLVVWVLLSLVQFSQGIGFIWCGRKDLAAMRAAAEERRKCARDREDAATS